MKQFILMFVISFAGGAFAGVQCDGTKIHEPGTRLYLEVSSGETPILSVYLVRGHRGGGSFHLIDKEEVEVEKLSSGEVLIVSKEGVPLIKIEGEFNGRGRRLGHLEFGIYQESLQCSVWN